MSSPSETSIFALVGLTSSISLAGISAGTSLLALPPLYKLPAATSTPIFSYIYHTGAKWAAPLAVISALSSSVAAYNAGPASSKAGAGSGSGGLLSQQRTGYAVAAVVTLLWMPWTLGIMMPTNNALVQMAGDERVRAKAGEEAAKALLWKWTWMNAVRAGFAFGGGIVGLATVVGGL